LPNKKEIMNEDLHTFELLNSNIHSLNKPPLSLSSIEFYLLDSFLIQEIRNEGILLFHFLFFFLLSLVCQFVSQHPLGLGNNTLSLSLQEGIRFLHHPLPASMWRELPLPLSVLIV